MTLSCVIKCFILEQENSISFLNDQTLHIKAGVQYFLLIRVSIAKHRHLLPIITILRWCHAIPITYTNLGYEWIYNEWIRNIWMPRIFKTGMDVTEFKLTIIGACNVQNSSSAAFSLWLFSMPMALTTSYTDVM